MTIVTTNTEAEALLLEAQLIKRFRPPYNVLLRDDKSFPFILLREDHAFPRVQKHRGARRAKGQYYGPFASAGSVTTHAQRAAEAVPAEKLLRQLFRQPRRGPACSTRSSAARRPASAGSSEADYAELVEDAKALPRRQVDRGAGAARQADGRGGRGAGLRAGRGLSRPAARADLHPGQPDDPRRRAGRCRHLRAGLQGRADVHPGLLHPRRPELGAPQLLPGAHRRRARRRGADAASWPNSTRKCRRRGGSWSTATCPRRELLAEALSRARRAQGRDRAAAARRPRAS